MKPGEGMLSIWRGPRKTCSVEGCKHPARARGLCVAHYQRARAGISGPLIRRGDMTGQPLTAEQRRAYDYLAMSYRRDGRLPTRRTMADAMGWASSNTAQKYIEALARRGLLTRVGRKRGDWILAHTNPPSPS